MSGLTQNGFEIKRLPEIISDIETDLKTTFPEINTAPDSVFGQIIGIVSKTISDIWEVMEAVYLSEYPASAEGFSLDNVAQYTGVIRLGATKTEVTAILNGVEGTVVPKGTQTSLSIVNEIFEQKEDETITKYKVLKCIIDISTLVPGYTYKVQIDGTDFEVLSDSSPTKDEIVQAFVTVINSGPPTQDKVTATDNLDGTFTVLVDDLQTPFSVVTFTNLTLLEIWTPTSYEALNTGPIVAVAGALTKIETPVSGLVAVNNLQDGATGRNIETDDELRIRRRASLRVLGAASFEAIRARILQEVESVLAVLIIENRTLITDGDGRPGKSFETIVVGGTDADIAEKLWQLKPAGIETWSDPGTGEHIQITDSQGNLQTINFSRPTNKYGWVDVQITLNPEETFPTNGIDLIRANILAYVNTFEIGQDMIIQKFYNPIYSVPGIKTVTIYIAKTNDITPIPPPPAAPWSTSNIAVAASEICLFDSSRITAAIV